MDPTTKALIETIGNVGYIVVLSVDNDGQHNQGNFLRGLTLGHGQTPAAALRRERMDRIWRPTPGILVRIAVRF